jgi:hypothetical protein
MTREPLRRRRRNLDSPYLAIGKLATNWAFIEYELDLWLVLIYSNCHGELVKKKCPILFGRKLELFRKALNTEKRLSAVAKAGLRIASKMSRLVQHRNKFLHSTIRKFSPSEIIFAKHEWSERVPKPRFFAVKVSQIEKHAQVMEDFAFELGFFGTQFEDAFSG